MNEILKDQISSDLELLQIAVEILYSAIEGSSSVFEARKKASSLCTLIDSKIADLRKNVNR